MKTIELITNIPLKNFNIQKWRSAVIEKVLKHKSEFEKEGITTDLFHNHDETKLDDGGISKKPIKFSSYPQIQYLSINGQAAIIGIGEGANALEVFKKLKEEAVTIREIEYPCKVVSASEKKWDLEASKELKTYRVKQWIPFNPKKHEVWKNTPQLSEHTELADKARFGHFFHFVDDLRLTIDREQLELYISQIHAQEYVDCFQNKKMALNIEFITYYSLPENIGIGQDSTLGFGRIERVLTKA